MNQDFLKLDDVCQEFFNVTPIVARRKAAVGALPVPAFRLAGTKRGPYLIRKGDLDAWIQEQIDSAVRLNSRMKQAGAV